MKLQHGNCFSCCATLHELLLERKLSTFSISNYPNLKKFQYSENMLLIRFWYILHDLTVFISVFQNFLDLPCLQNPIIILYIAKSEFSKIKFSKMHVIDYLWHDLAVLFTALKMKFSIKHFFSKCVQIGFGHIYWRNF